MAWTFTLLTKRPHGRTRSGREAGTQAREGEAGVGADLGIGLRSVRAMPVRQASHPWDLDAGIRSGMTAVVPAGIPKSDSVLSLINI